MDLNPWQVDSLSAFNFLCCPECVYRSKEEHSFQDHALANHPQSFTFFHGFFNLGPFKDIDDTKSIKEEQPDEKVDINDICQKDLVVKEEQDPDENALNDYDEDYDYPSETHDDSYDERNENYEPEEPRKKRKKPGRKPKNTEKKEVISKRKSCGICSKEFESISQKNEHVLTEHQNPDGLLKCNECDDTTSDYNSMLAHKLSKHNTDSSNITHKCQICQRVFANKIRLRKHIESVHEKRKTNCPTCNKEVGLHSLDNHIKNFHQTDRTNKSFRCEECDFSTHLPQLLKKHVKLKHRKEEYRFSCDQCDKKFAFQSQLKQHVSVKHEGLKPYICEKCGKGWGADAKAHFQTHVENGCKASMYPDGIKCHSCEVTFTVEGNYIKHHMKVHGGLPPNCKDKELFMCDQCSTLCISKRALKAHVLKTHQKTTRKRTSCPHCEKTFAIKQACEEHIKVKHEGITPFKCDKCHRCYGTLYGLKSHKFSMHQRVKCDECGQEVSNTLILTRHKAKAHGIRPASVYQCNYCPLFYTQETQLEKHMNNHHVNQFE